ncbi:BMP family ABC transporter substrate-binding protein [Pacificitalea manganoxidans]|uniref:BMP family ABC transporter substrate-binding protein n=1 Tax=Pacificitalea manganoxidans TaxID=1411902 RepID=A0A291M2R9_9RHOB|nr:BMP family ABC transporter substrate-binding protein [Pacificitalea manganoxidans]MAQ45661.1 BMP family ABC transporter substrate-binding protein [Actibacterium sp.]OWU70093.1 membrane protein [Roseovarius sp. 22II1-1F6A]ATI43015.1 BMP family ABC transporter substrate-binding protein [Pacificitalea manganoxidans]MBF53457.1 BMP family ABC transporter substrate-binding protein [Actibacterium sp.]MDR6307061.1 basic membrane protein A [Pacificitalea manganoxidans]|tara:strand:- start:740 stop:1732 length:993 start_codon:yes stop_codon:yes gene_type:complete
MTLMRTFLGASAGLALTAGALAAEPALIYDLGGKYDKSFNESAFNGAQRWADETGEDFLEIELSSEAQREQALRRFAEAGANPIITTGFAMSSPIEGVAPDYPDTTFVTIDGYVDAPNVLTIGFSEHEGSYLVGMLAAMASESDTVGFIGGMDVPLIRKFACGYAQGVKAVKPEATVISNMTGTDPSAWNDPVKGSELTKAQISQGADVIFAAAGGTGVGVLQTAADEDILSIGVDSNQNHLHPGKVLTSMLKRVDVAVYDILKAGEAEGGIQTMALEDDGVGYAVDDNNRDLITEDMTSAVEEAKQQIIDGGVEVHDYTSDDSCPALTF